MKTKTLDKNILGEFGFNIEWVMDSENDTHADFVAKKIISRSSPSNQVYKEEVYLSGFIKWDSCSHFYFGENGESYLHLCGQQAIPNHNKLMAYIFNRAFELMHRTPED